MQGNLSVVGEWGGGIDGDALSPHAEQPRGLVCIGSSASDCTLTATKDKPHKG